VILDCIRPEHFRMDEEAIMIEANERGNERYAAFGLRVKQIFAAKGKILLSKAAATNAKLKAAIAAKAAKAKVAATASTSKLKAALTANARYTAYSSDVGEAFRPVIPEWGVKATYGLAVAYIAGDVAHTTYKETLKEDGNPPRARACFFNPLAPGLLLNHTHSWMDDSLRRDFLLRGRLSGHCFSRAAHVHHSPNSACRAVRDEARGALHQVGTHGCRTRADPGAALCGRRAGRARHRYRLRHVVAR